MKMFLKLWCSNLLRAFEKLDREGGSKVRIKLKELYLIGRPKVLTLLKMIRKEN